MAAACFFVKDLIASRIGQGIDPQIEILVLGGDARLADQHALPLLPLSQRQKPKPSSLGTNRQQGSCF